MGTHDTPQTPPTELKWQPGSSADGQLYELVIPRHEVECALPGACSWRDQRTTSAALEVWYPRVVPMSLIRDPVDESTNEKPRRSGASKDGSDGTRTRDLRRDRPAL